MHQSMHKRVYRFIVLGLVLSACSGAETVRPSLSTTSASEQPTTPAASIQPLSPTVGGEVAALMTYLTDPQAVVAQLKHLDSYRVRTQTTTTTTHGADTTSALTTEMIEARINTPLAVHLQVRTAMDVPPQETWLLDGVVYQVQPTDTDRDCTSTMLNPQMLEITFDMTRSLNGGMLPALLASAEPKRVAEAVMMHGMVADQYQMTLDQNGITITGDFWVNQAGLVINAETRMAIASEQDTVLTESVYALDQINLVAPMGIPDGCTPLNETLMGQMPRMDDAQNLLITDQMLSYGSKYSHAEVIALYTMELTQQGYRVTTVSETESGAMLDASTSEHTLQIVIGTGTDTPTAVLIQMQ